VVGDLGAVGVGADEVRGLGDGLLTNGQLNGVVCAGLRGNVGGQEDVVVGLSGGEVGVGHGELVEGERARLVRAEHGDTGHLLDGGESLDDDALLCELLGADGHRDREDSWETDGDGSDREHEDLGDGRERVQLLVDDEDDEEDDDQHQGDGHEEVADDVDDLLEVALLVGDSDERGSAADKRVATRLGHDGDLLALLDDRGGEGNVVLELGHGERLAGEGRLVDQQLVCLLAGRANTHESFFF